MKKTSLLLLRLYRKTLSPIMIMLFGHACRFEPTCSDYSMQAIETYGFWKGSFLSIKRISKCHPLSKPGYDPLV